MLSVAACGETPTATKHADGKAPASTDALADSGATADPAVAEPEAQQQADESTAEAASDLDAQASGDADASACAASDGVDAEAATETESDTGADSGPEAVESGEALVAADLADASELPPPDTEPEADAEPPSDAKPETAPKPCTPTNCDDGQPCTDDQCDATSGACVHVPVTGPCAAGAGVCTAGKCCMPTCTAGPCSANGCGGQCACPAAQVCHAGACIADPEWSDWPAPPDAPTAYTATDDVVVDNLTKLTWQRAQMPNTLIWAEATAACDALMLGGYSDWRLPTATELFSIVDLTRLSPAIEPNAFPGTTAAPFWSASPHAKSANVAWAVDFANGRIDFGPYATWQARRVRCVRSPVKLPGGKG